MKDFKLPDLGEGVHEGQIVRVMVKPGDAVREDQPLMEVETDKAAVEIPCPLTGVVEKVHVEPGQLVHVGDVMVSFSPSLEGGGKGVGESASAPVASRSTRGSTHPPTPSLSGRGNLAASRTRAKPASPATRRLARELGVDIETINGSGPGGRVQRADVERVAKHSPSLQGGGKGVGEAFALTVGSRSSPVSTNPPNPGAPSLGGRGRLVAARVPHSPLPESQVVEPVGTDDTDHYGPIRRAPLTQARKTIANVMAQSWSTIPHATDFDDADVTELDRLRQGYSPPDVPQRRLTMLAFVVRAVVRALQRFPEFNAQYDDEPGEIIYKRYINIAIGVHTERGLVPMVIRETDQLTIPQISDELSLIAEKARTASFAVNDTRGGTYTVSNPGAMGGSRYSTPIITPGQAAVLAIGRSRWMPWVMETETRGIAPRLIMPLSHSIDHRLLDGGQEVRFMQHFIADLQNPARLLL